MNASLARLACSLVAAAGLAAGPRRARRPANAGKPMHIVVTFTPGGAPDILARLIGEKLSVAWNQPVLIDNKPGAGGNTGADFGRQGAARRLRRSSSARSARTRSTARSTPRCRTTWSRTSRR